MIDALDVDYLNVRTAAFARIRREQHRDLETVAKQLLDLAPAVRVSVLQHRYQAVASEGLGHLHRKAPWNIAGRTNAHPRNACHGTVPGKRMHHAFHAKCETKRGKRVAAG